MVSDFKNLQIINQFCWCFLGDNEYDRVEVSDKTNKLYKAGATLITNHV